MIFLVGAVFILIGVETSNCPLINSVTENGSSSSKQTAPIDVNTTSVETTPGAEHTTEPNAR